MTHYIEGNNDINDTWLLMRSKDAQQQQRWQRQWTSSFLKESFERKEKSQLQNRPVHIWSHNYLKRCQVISMETGKPFQQKVLENWISTWKKKKKLNCSLAPHNILLETYHGLKHKNNNYNSLDTNIGEYIYFGFGKDFLKREQKHTT